MRVRGQLCVLESYMTVYDDQPPPRFWLCNRIRKPMWMRASWMTMISTTETVRKKPKQTASMLERPCRVDGSASDVGSVSQSS